VDFKTPVSQNQSLLAMAIPTEMKVSWEQQQR